MSNHAIWTHAQTSVPAVGLLASHAGTPTLTRHKMLRHMSDAMQTCAMPFHQVVAEILESVVSSPDLLDGLVCSGSPERYTRHLLHEGAGFSVLAVVWQPGQMSPVHSHRAWCALGVHRGELIETWFAPRESDTGAEHSPSGGEALRVTGCRQLGTGAVSHSAPSDTLCHRMANLGVESAISIHAYGVRSIAWHDLNRVWAD